MMLTKIVRNLNKQVSSKFINSDKYWMKSPSSILLKKAIQNAIDHYAVGKKVLDAGAGRLAYKPLIISVAKKYISSDFKKTHPNLDVVTNIEKMSFSDNLFDVAFCSQVLEHVPHPHQALKEIFRVLKPGGIAIITVPFLGYIHNSPYDFYRYTEHGLRILVKETNFQIIKLKPLGGFFSFLGYVRSTTLMPLFGIPILGLLFFYLNYFAAKTDIFLDKITKNSKIFPLNYLLIVRKK